MDLGKSPQVSGLVDRAKAIILNPDATWPALAAEQTTPGDIITRHALPLAAIGPVAMFVGLSLFFGGFHFGIFSLTKLAIWSLGLNIIALIGTAFLTEFLAPKFGGEANRIQSFKLAAASLTPYWIAGILAIFPTLAPLAIIGLLYGIFLFYQGSTPLVKVPQGKAPAFTAAVAVAALVLFAVSNSIAMRVLNPFGLGGYGITASSSNSTEVNIPGVGKVDTGNIEQMGKQMEAAANGEVTPVDTAKLQALLPATLGSYSRTSLDTGAVGQMGRGVSATYTSGDKSIKLSVIDSAGLGALAGMAGAFGVEQSHEDADGYDRTKSVNGQMVIEKWSKSGRGEFSQQVGGRFFVSAEGEAGSIDELKAAVAGIDAGALAALAK